MAISGLLFLAFAFFAVAQAGTVRSGGQSAADAAAVGAAKSDREQLFDGFVEALEDDDGWEDWLDGIGEIDADGCGEAEYFAGRNRSDVQTCAGTTRDDDRGYSVKVQTRFDTGKSIVPGASNKKATANATAVVQPRCDVESHGDEVELTCDDDEFTLEPGSGDVDITAADLFSIVLVD